MDADKKLQDMTNGLAEGSTENNKSWVILTPSQFAVILRAWTSRAENPPSIKELLDIVFPGQNLDARSAQGRAVKSFLATHNIKPKTNVHVKVGDYELSPSDKEFIQNNSEKMTALEMVRVMFNSPTLTPLSKEFRAVKKFIIENNITTVDKIENQKDSDEFIPPKTYTKCLNLINQYGYNPIDINNVSEKEKRYVQRLISYLHSPRFLQMTKAYTVAIDQELFVSEFIRSTYDKPDLTADELNLYINLCSDYVMAGMLQRQMVILDERLHESAQDTDKNMSMSLAEMIGKKTVEYNNCLGRQKTLVKELNGSRSARLNKQLSSHASLLSLFEYWRDADKREKMKHLATLKREALKEEVTKLENMESIKAEMFGAIQVL